MTIWITLKDSTRHNSREPTDGFRFLQQDEISTLKLQELSDDAEDGYIFEVDLHYPTRLHDRHDDYPLAPESLLIDRSMRPSSSVSCVSRICTSEESHTQFAGKSQVRSTLS